MTLFSIYVFQRIGFDVHQLQDDYHHKLPSLKLISQLKSLSKMRKEHYKVLNCIYLTFIGINHSTYLLFKKVTMN